MDVAVPHAAHKAALANPGVNVLVIAATPHQAREAAEALMKSRPTDPTFDTRRFSAVTGVVTLENKAKVYLVVGQTFTDLSPQVYARTFHSTFILDGARVTPEARTLADSLVLQAVDQWAENAKKSWDGTVGE